MRQWERQAEVLGVHGCVLLRAGVSAVGRLINTAECEPKTS
jgi:hypothetical protein